MDMSDNLLLYISSISCVLLTIYQLCGRHKRTGALSAIVLLAYSLPLYYLFFFHSDYGAGFTWWFYLLALNFLYILSTVINIIINAVQNRR